MTLAEEIGRGGGGGVVHVEGLKGDGSRIRHTTRAAGRKLRATNGDDDDDDASAAANVSRVPERATEKRRLPS